MEKSLFEDLLKENEVSSVEEDQFEPKEPQLEEPSEEEEEQEEEDSTGEDERIRVLYDILVDTQVVPGKEDFKATPEEFEGLLSELPQRLFENAINQLPEHIQAILEYGLNKPDASITDLGEFFEKYYKQSDDSEPDTDDQAYEFLKPIVMKNKLFNTEAKAERYLDELLENGELLQVAKEMYTEQKAVLEQTKQQELEELKRQQEALIEEQRRYAQNIYETIESLDWDKTRKAAAIKNLDPQEVVRKNALIQKSPKAVAQLADLYSYFDETKGEFDFSSFGIRKVSQKLTKEKEQLQGDKISSHLSKIKTGKEGKGESFWSAFKPIN